MSLEQLWAQALTLAKRVRVDRDPAAVGPLGLARTASHTIELMAELSALVGPVLKTRGAAKRRAILARHMRRSVALATSSTAGTDEELRAYRGKPVLLKAAIDARLVDNDGEIARLEAAISELDDLLAFLDIVREQLKSAKEVSRQHVDIVRAQREEP